MMARRIRVSSSALGCRDEVTVLVYPDEDAMRTAAHRYNGADVTNTAAVTQATTDQDRRVGSVIVRIAEGASLEVVAHELHHAATAVYGAHVGDRVSRSAHLNHYNEQFAYLFSDLFASLVARL